MFTWNFSTHKEHSASWYIVAVIVILSLVTYGIIEGIYTMSITAFLFAGVYILMENNTHPITQVQVENSGIRVGKTFYDYASIATFSLIYANDVPLYLRITPRKKISTILDIPINQQEVDVAALIEYLGSYIEEEKNVKFSNSDVLIHLMRL